jgi:hypothetical protein
MKYIGVIKSRRMRLEEYILSVGERVSAFKVLVRKPEIKRPLGSPRLRYEDNFKFDLKGKGFQYTDRFFCFRMGFIGELL